MISGSACGVIGAYYNTKTDNESKIKAFNYWIYSNPTLATYLIGLYFGLWQVDLGIILPIGMYAAFMWTSWKGKKNVRSEIIFPSKENPQANHQGNQHHDAK